MQRIAIAEQPVKQCLLGANVNIASQVRLTIRQFVRHGQKEDWFGPSIDVALL